MSSEPKRLYRSRDQRMIGGVCGGLGEYLGMDPTMVRLVVILITLFWPLTPLAYLVLLLVVPEAPRSAAQEITPVPDSES
jgi:phage shock protein C